MSVSSQDGLSKLPRDVVMVSTADWDNPHWTNKQHLAVRLGARGMRVLYLESLGLRPPRANARDLMRSFRRLWRGLRRARRPTAGVWVVSPLQIPFQRSVAVRRVNQALLAVQVRLYCWRIGLDCPILWLFNPLAFGLRRAVHPALSVYQCVDELASSPGLPSQALQEAEQEVLAHADAVIVTSRPLFESRKGLARRILLSENTVDFAHFAAGGVPPPWVTRIAKPRLGYVGAVSNYKVDLDLLAAVATFHPEWQFVLVGSVGEGDPGTDVRSLASLPNVHFVPPQPFRDLPAILQGFDVCLLPSRMNKYTEGMFPMKFFEYCASGKPIVATRLPSLEQYLGFCQVGATPLEFAEAVQAALAEDGGKSTARQELARTHDWESRIDDIIRFLAKSGEKG